MTAATNPGMPHTDHAAHAPDKALAAAQPVPDILLLEVTSIDGYDRNPRLCRNEGYEGIEAGLRAHGFTDTLTVTRRGDGARYMLSAGSNTTLEILKHLWETTREERFRQVRCVVQPYEGETRLLAQHLGENLNRGGMRFWEVAKGMAELLAMIEAERGGGPMSVRDQAEALTSRGLRADKTSVSRWRFAAERLDMLGPVASRLTRLDVGDLIQPRLTLLRLLASRFAIDETTYWSEIVEPVLAAIAIDRDWHGSEGFDANGLCARVEAALAARVREPLADICQMLSVLKLSPELRLAELRMPSPNLAAGPPPGDNERQSDPARPGPRQAPLPLGPGLVRAGRPQAAASALTSARASPLHAEPLRLFHDAVQNLLDHAQLGDTLRLHDPLPLGFYLEVPDPAVHARHPVQLGSAEDHLRAIKSHVWWSLVRMSGQFREASLSLLDPSSSYYRYFAMETDANPLEGTDIDDLPPETDEVLLRRVAPTPLRHVMRLLNDVEACAAEVFETEPDRWQRLLEIHHASSEA